MSNPILRKSIIRMSVLFLAPAVVLLCVFFFYPAIEAGVISLYDWNGFSQDKTFVGLGNFKELFTNTRFWRVPMLNTLKYMVFGGIFIFAFTLLFSGILSTNLKGKKVLRAIIFFPNIINPVAITVLWSFIYNNQWGLLNSILDAVGLGALKQVLYDENYRFEYGKGTYLVQHAKPDAVILSSGRGVHEALKAATLLEDELAVDVVGMPSLDETLLEKLARQNMLLLVAEQNNGYLCGQLARLMLRCGISRPAGSLLAVNALDEEGKPRFIHSGTYGQIVQHLGLDAASLAGRIKNAANK